MTDKSAAGECFADGNLIDSMNAAGETVTRSYDLANRLATLTDALERTTQLTYDSLDRVTEVSCPLVLRASA